MTGVAWFVQLVHYPLLARMEHSALAENIALTRRMVAPLMAAEALTAGLLLALRPGALTALGAALLAVIWVSTLAVQYPQHRELARRFDAGLHAKLLRFHWIRAAAWTARSIVASALLA